MEKDFQAKVKSHAKALKWKGTWYVEKKRRKVRVAGTEKARREVAQNEVRKIDHQVLHKPVKAFGLYPKSNKEPLKGFQ